MPVRGFSGEPEAYGYYAAHKDHCKRPVEFAPGEWEVPNGSTEITQTNPIKGVKPFRPRGPGIKGPKIPQREE